MDNPQLQLIALSAVFVAVALIVFGLIFVGERRKREALKKVALRFSGALPLFLTSMRGKYQGFQFCITLVPQGKHEPPKMVLRFFRTSGFTLRIYREGPLSRLGKRLGLVREVQINDASFDSQFLIFSNRPVQAVNFLTLNTKNTLKELFADGFDSFRIDHRAVSLQKPNYAIEKDLDPDRVERLLRDCISMTGSLA